MQKIWNIKKNRKSCSVNILRWIFFVDAEFNHSWSHCHFISFRSQQFVNLKICRKHARLSIAEVFYVIKGASIKFWPSIRLQCYTCSLWRYQFQLFLLRNTWITSHWDLSFLWIVTDVQIGTKLRESKTHWRTEILVPRLVKFKVDL